MSVVELGRTFCRDVMDFYDNSLTKMQSQPRAGCERVHSAAVIDRQPKEAALCLQH